MDILEIVLIRTGMWRAKHVLTRRPYKIFEISAVDQLQPLWWPQVEVILKVDFTDVDRRRRPPKESSAFVVVVRISSFLGKRRRRSRRGRRRNGSTTRISWGNRRGNFLVVVRKKGVCSSSRPRGAAELQHTQTSSSWKVEYSLKEQWCSVLSLLVHYHKRVLKSRE